MTSSPPFVAPPLLPLDLWIVIGVVVVVGIYLAYRGGYKTIPVKVLWVFRNYSGRMFNAEEDLQGIFLTLKTAKGKKFETLKKTGQPLDVVEIDEKHNRAWLVKWQEEGGEKVEKVFLDVSMGGLKHTRLYATVEGTGETMDWIKKVEDEGKKKSDSGSAGIIHEEKSAVKEFLKLWAEAAAGTMKTLIIPLIAGAGLGASTVFIILVLLGHLK